MTSYLLLLFALQSPLAAAEDYLWVQKSSMEILSAAKNGNADAQYEIGRRYDLGLGFPKRKDKAISWYMKAANIKSKSQYLYFSPMGQNPSGRMTEVTPAGRSRSNPLARKRLAELLSQPHNPTTVNSEKAGQNNSDIITRSPKSYTPGLRSLLQSVGIDLDDKVLMSSVNKTLKLNFKGFEGSFRLQTFACTGSEQAPVGTACEIHRIIFNLTTPNLKCVTMVAVDEYVERFGWRADQPKYGQGLAPGAMAPLPDMEKTFRDGEGAVLLVGPAFEKSCVSRVIFQNLKGREN